MSFTSYLVQERFGNRLMLSRWCIAFAWILITASTVAAGNPTPQSNAWRKIGFGHGPGYHAYNACPPCAAAPAQHGRGGMNYYGGYYVPGTYPGPQAGWFNHGAAPQAWSDSMVHGGPLSPVAAPGESIIISDDAISAESSADEPIATPKPAPAAKRPSAAPPANLPAAPKAKQPPVKPAPDQADEPAQEALPDAAPNDHDAAMDGVPADAFSFGQDESSEVAQEMSLPVEVEDADEQFLSDEPAGALLPE